MEGRTLSFLMRLSQDHEYVSHAWDIRLRGAQESPGEARRALESPGEARRAQDSPGEPGRAKDVSR